MGHNDDITIEGLSLKKYLENLRDPGTIERRQEEQKRPLYRKARLRVKNRKEPDGKVRYLTEEEIINLYGLEAKRMSRVEEILWAIKSQIAAEGKTLSEMVTDAGFKFQQSSHSAAMPRVWRKLGDDGAGLISRFKSGTVYHYYPASEDLQTLSYDELKKKMKLRPARTVQPEPAETEEPEEEVEETPEHMDISIHIKHEIKITFGWAKE